MGRLKQSESELWRGTQTVDLETVACAQWFRIDGAVAEAYDIGVLPDVGCSMSLNFAREDVINLP